VTSTRFERHVAIVTGGASGIGAATVSEFADEGASIVFLDRNRAAGEEFVRKLEEGGLHVRFVAGDVAKPVDCRRAVKEALSAFDRLDFVVNNAVSPVIKGVSGTVQDWQRSLGVNLVGAANMAQAALEPMKGSGRGAIVNVASVSAFVAQPNHWTYNAAKGGLVTLTKCMALDFSEWGIRVNSVSPGWIWTPASAETVDGNRQSLDRMVGPFHMLGRCGEAREVARTILFLCSDDASFITGTDLRVDGGYLAMPAEGLFLKSLR
jgi:NAD(P)-dependent dehydrogenase (short-subunit alcohol dehydrogenase family)